MPRYHAIVIEFKTWLILSNSICEQKLWNMLRLLLSKKYNLYCIVIINYTLSWLFSLFNEEISAWAFFSSCCSFFSSSLLPPGLFCREKTKNLNVLKTTLRYHTQTSIKAQDEDCFHIPAFHLFIYLLFNKQHLGFCSSTGWHDMKLMCVPKLFTTKYTRTPLIRTS